MAKNKDEKKATAAQAPAAPEAAAPAATADQGGVAGGAGDAGSSEPASGSAAPAVSQPQGDDQGQGDAQASIDDQNAPQASAGSGAGANTGEVGGGPSGTSSASPGAGDGGDAGSGSSGSGETQGAESEPTIEEKLAAVTADLEALRSGASQPPPGKTLEEWIAEGEALWNKLAAALEEKVNPDLKRGDLVLIEGNRTLRVLTADAQYVVGITVGNTRMRVARGKVIGWVIP